jgi:hypothetical protein
MQLQQLPHPLLVLHLTTKAGCYSGPSGLVASAMQRSSFLYVVKDNPALMTLCTDSIPS